MIVAMEKWFTTEKIYHDTYAISEYGHKECAHSYLFVGRNKAVLVDTGLGIGNINEEVKQITSLPIIVLTTHAHWDHIGGHRHFDDIRIHKNDADWLEDGIPLPPEVISNALSEKSFSNGRPDWFDPKKYEIFRGKPSKLLVDGIKLDLGERFLQIVHTPGHSPGSICVYESDTGILATGDFVYQGTLYCNFDSTSPELYLKSLERIAELKVKKVLPGHNSLNIASSIINQSCDLLRELNHVGKLRHGAGLCGDAEIKILL